MRSRLDDFAGTEESYISYLEQTVALLRAQLNSPHGRASTSTDQHDAPEDVPLATPLLRSCREHRTAPVTATTAEGRSPKRRKTRPHWKTVAETLVQCTPQPAKWMDTMSNKGIFDLLEDDKAAKYLLGIDDTPNLHVAKRTSVAHEAGNVLEGLTRFAHDSADRESKAIVALALANFQKFLVLSACAVLLEGDHSPSEVFNVVRICVGSGVSEDYCKRSVKASKYINQLVDTLQFNGWGDRASELLLLCKTFNLCHSRDLSLAGNRPPSYYYALSRSADSSLEYLRSMLCDHERMLHSQGNPQWMPLSVPVLVFSMLEQQVEYVQSSYH